MMQDYGQPDRAALIAARAASGPEAWNTNARELRARIADDAPSGAVAAFLCVLLAIMGLLAAWVAYLLTRGVAP